MPLIHGDSRADVSENIRRERNAGKPERQSVAVALSTADRYGKRAAGGSAPTAPTYATAAPSVNASGFVPTPQTAPGTSGYQTGNFGLDLNTGALTPETQSMLQQFAMRGLPGGQQNGPQGYPGGPANPAPASTGPTSAQLAAMGDPNNFGGNLGGGNRGGNVNRLADGGDPMVGYEARHAEHAGLFSHPSGLVHTLGPGRTDNVPMSVAAGSHVIPADVVAGLGEGNTLAGANVLGQEMKGGPGGISLPSGPRKSTIPAAPRIGHLARGGEPEWEGHAIKVAKGGAVDGVKCILAGGEWLMGPDEVQRTKHAGKTGHEAIDHWIMERRAEDVKKLRKLPGPVGMKK